ncbi:hypothetical protein ScPMuIL_001512 [Solemya velum]
MLLLYGSSTYKLDLAEASAAEKTPIESEEELTDQSTDFYDLDYTTQISRSNSNPELFTPKKDYKFHRFLSKLTRKSENQTLARNSFKNVKCYYDVIAHPDYEGGTDFELVDSRNLQYVKECLDQSRCLEHLKHLKRGQVTDVETDGKLVNGSSSKVHKMTAEGRNLSLQELANMLRVAVSSGDQANAQQAASKLASKAADIKIEVVSQGHSAEEKENSFSLRVNVEDREASGSSITLTVKASDTIGTLKRKMLLKHKFPMEVQKWIIGNRIVKDEETLRENRVKGTGHSVYLYLVSSKSVGVTRDAFQAKFAKAFANNDGYVINLPRQQSNMSSSSTSLSPRIQELSMRLPPSRQPSHGPLEEVVPEPTSHPVLNLPSPPESHRPGGRSPVVDTEEQDLPTYGWQCPRCTFINSPTRPGCMMCSGSRPSTYKVPEGFIPSEEEKLRLKQEQQVEERTLLAEKKRKLEMQKRSEENFRFLRDTESQGLIENSSFFECPICFDTIPQGDGAILRECLHSFCKSCLKAAVTYNEEPVLRCPYQDDVYACGAVLQDREVKALVSKEAYDQYLQRSLKTAESQATNSFHCKSVDCQGWCLYEDHVNFFVCPVCKRENCLTCKAIHMGKNCRQYQEDLKILSRNDEAARITQESLTKMIARGEAMHCPLCKVIVQKKDGCDWLKCSICKTEICWVTKGPRWGPEGPGDMSGGCQCNVNNKKCHPTCNNCH